MKRVDELMGYLAHMPRQDETPILRELLGLFAKNMSDRSKRAIIKKLTDETETFRRSDANGHDVWYPHHVLREYIARSILED